jgi:hypothetical protein
MNNMIDGFNKLNDFYNLDIDIYSISCENSNKERKEILKSFSENDDKIQLLFNIKILNECIDIPSCDSIYISYPPKNKITTIQRINRATRINKNNPYKIANIYIWCDEYEEILETLSSIKEYDSMFKDKIKINTLDFYHNRNDKELKLIENYIIENRKLPSTIDKDKNIKSLGNWLLTQQRNYKNKKEIMKNEEIRKLWEDFIEKYNELFKSNEEKWNEKLVIVEKYVIENSKLPSTKSKDKNIKSLGIWLSRQQQNYKNKKEIMKNEEIKKEWEDFIEKYNELFKSNEEKWKENLNKLENYIIENRKLPSTIDKDNNIKSLACWVLTSQKTKYKNNKGIMKNNEIKKIWEDFIEKYNELFKSNEEKWKENLNKLENYIIENRKLPSTRDKDNNIKSLACWLSHQQQNYKNKEKIMKNEEIKKEWEDFIEKYSVYMN